MPKQPTTPTITISPSPVTVGSDVTITVTGITSRDYLNVDVHDSAGVTAVPVGYAKDGTVVCAFHVWWSGEHTVELRGTSRGKWTTLATATFTAG